MSDANPIMPTMMSPRAPTSPPTESAKLTHKFSGLSVWLEPDPDHTQLLSKEMDYLSENCGGCHFVPHCTLLYNTSLPPEPAGQPVPSGVEQASKKILKQKQQGERMLKRCMEKFIKQQQKSLIQQKQKHDQNIQGAQSNQGNITYVIPSNNHESRNNGNVKLKPTSHYYFPYPKSADNGRGFGCCISLLILETTPELACLHEVVKDSFPPDERHGGGSSDNTDGGCNNHSSTTTSSSTAHQNGAKNISDHEILDNNDKREQVKNNVKFQPHMALIYAPEQHDNVKNGWLEARTLQMEREQRYIQWTSQPSSSFEEKENAVRDWECKEHRMQQKNELPTSCEDAPSSSASWNARYLSLWSTEGTLEEWYPVAKLDLKAYFES